MTKPERRALKYQSWILKRRERIERDWHHIARYLKIVYDESLYEQFDLSFDEWLQSVRVDKTTGYNLVAIQNSLHKEKLETLPIGLAQLALPHVRHLDHAAAGALIEDIRDMTWHDARQHLKGDDLVPRWVATRCPRCGGALNASRAVRLEVPG